MDDVHSEIYKGYTIKIWSDSDSESPRDWDNLGTMLCYHGRYTLGDKDPVYSQHDQGSWQELADKLVKEQHAAVILPLYLFDHGGITMSTGKFSCPWDSGQVGFIYVTREQLLKEFGGKRVSKDMIAKAEKILEGEVETYDHYIRGNVYGYTTYAGEGEDLGDSSDSCGGFIGDYDNEEYGPLQEAKSAIDHEIEREYKKRFAHEMALQDVME